MDNKICSKCNKLLPVSDFYLSNKKSHKGYQSRCKNCHKEYRNQHYKDNKKKYLDKAKKATQEKRLWFQEYKSTLKCSICPENHPACLDFHHLNNKISVVSKMVGATSRKILLEEIAKCIVLCANCHRKLHAGVISDSGSTSLCQGESAGSIPA